MSNASPGLGTEPFNLTPEELEADWAWALNHSDAHSLAFSRPNVEWKQQEGKLQPTNEKQAEGLVSEKEAARILGVPISNLRYRRLREMPPEWVKVGRRVRYRPSTLAAFIEQNTVKLQASEPPGGRDETRNS